MPRLLKSLAVEMMEGGKTMVKARVEPCEYTEGKDVLSFELITTPDGTVIRETTLRPHPLPMIVARDQQKRTTALLATLVSLFDFLESDHPAPAGHMRQYVEVGAVNQEIPGSEVGIAVIPLDSPLGQSIARQVGYIPPDDSGTKH